MAVKLELYRIFQTVAETGSISGAAEKLYLTQSALSQAIKQLESQLQVRLFSRTSRGVRLTTEGQLLYDYVRQAMGLLQSGEEKLALSRSLLLGQLSIGANDTITRTYLLPRLEAFHKAYPAIRLKILNGTSQMVLDMLSEGQVDVAFASQPARPQNFSIHPCFAMHTIFVASSQYPCSFEKTYSLPEIAALPLILLDKRASSRNYVEQLFLTHGISLQPEIELASHDLLISLAQIGLGVACITEEYAGPALAHGEIRPLLLETPLPPRTMYLCTLQGVTPTVAAQRFVSFIAQSNAGGSFPPPATALPSSGR